ncbi:histone acetylation protein-domain-containing protein [Trichophaea hybrida]|nr:histone acetylation protein-domain-containing protein [Trichophaea hybrida]
MSSNNINSRSAVASALSSLLPSDLSISLYHIATSPAKTTPLFTPAPSKRPAATTLESHFIAISHENVLAFAIELLVYTLVASGERIIFISKADSSGYLPSSVACYTPAHEPESKVSLLRNVAMTVVRVILENARAANPTSKITVSLFARSQTQYLFPNSASNTTKHILEDRGLIAWWCRVLDPIFQQYIDQDAKAYLLVPGFDRLQTRKLFPERQDTKEAQWICGHPLVTDPERDLTVREIIPHYPDDPKARFLNELNGDESGKVTQRGKKWNSIRSVDDFWEMMSMRQECSLGRCVGFIWVPGNQESTQVNTQQSTQQFTKPNIQLTIDTQLSGSSLGADPSSESPKKRARPEPASILMSPRKKKLKALDSDNLILKPPLVSSAIVLDEKRYQRTIDSLLYHTDFGTIDLAKDGTRKWVQRSYAAVKASDVIIRDGWDWGELVTGTVDRAAEKAKEKEGTAGVNVLMGRRKKSEPNVLTMRKQGKKPAESISAANTLDAGKSTETEQAAKRGEFANAPMVNVLGANLVRRRPKAEEN